MAKAELIHTGHTVAEGAEGEATSLVSAWGQITITEAFWAQISSQA